VPAQSNTNTDCKSDANIYANIYPYRHGNT
jgi:hypothetical protein